MCSLKLPTCMCNSTALYCLKECGVLLAVVVYVFKIGKFYVTSV